MSPINLLTLDLHLTLHYHHFYHLFSLSITCSFLLHCCNQSTCTLRSHPWLDRENVPGLASKVFFHIFFHTDNCKANILQFVVGWGSCCGCGVLPWMNFWYLCTVNMTASLRPVPCANFAAKKTGISFFLILRKFVNWLTHQTVVVVIYLVNPNFHRYKHLVFPGLYDMTLVAAPIV